LHIIIVSSKIKNNSRIIYLFIDFVNICRKKINYQKNIHTRQIVKDYIENSDDAIARIKKHPTCIDAKINDNKILLEIELELVCEVIGETKMQVTVFTEPEVWDVDDFENEIEEDFIKDN
jgi:spore coat protein E